MMKLKLASLKLPIFRSPTFPPIYHVSLTSSPFRSLTSPSKPSVQVSGSSPFMVVYFIHSSEWSREKVVQASKRHLHLTSPQKPDAVLEFLRGVSLSESQLSAAISCRPIILTTGVKSSLLPKVKLFESLGASGKELANLVTSSTNCLGNNVDRHILPCIDVLRDLFQDNKKGLEGPSLSLLIYRSPRVLIVKLENLSVACEIGEQFRLACTSS
ncbi:hypothetical protein NE237_024338 [Protea cynaroides]|uniref:Uncharacterized protein n=1 Tax=Protea cynaroides TaxID=273540 RepID=A0A9Q0K5B9_9MAGN|nr:hypothetical protein NE237_024338 [Protea cynaroides]